MELEDLRLNIHSGPVAIGVILLILYIILSIFTGFGAVGSRFLELLTAFTKNFDIAFALIPIYLGWFISDYYQERKGTDLGNAMANGFLGLWVGIDWIRNSYSVYQTAGGFLSLFLKVLLALGMLYYAYFIMSKAAHGARIIRYVGRIREVSYFAIMFTPIVYEVVALDGLTLAAAILFFPVVYGVAELVDYYILPPPEIELIEEREKESA